VSGRQVALYFAWSRPEEIAAPLGVLEDRFPTLFELRRLSWPHLEKFADPARFDQGIGGFLENVQLANFELFAEQVAKWTGSQVRRAERRTEVGMRALDAQYLSGIDTLIVISFDSATTKQQASAAEIAAVKSFLDDPDHVLFICPHHDIGNTDGLRPDEWLARQELEFHHHGDIAIPARQRFGDFGISLLNALGLPVKNRFGLRPAKMPDGSPAPIEATTECDRFGLMSNVASFNLHYHLPHFERIDEGATKLDVLARQQIDTAAPPHPFAASGRRDFDALLQSKPDVFVGAVLVCDTTIWSSTVGGLDSLQQFWQNVTLRPRRS
jgi:hypothetical protein